MLSPFATALAPASAPAAPAAALDSPPVAAPKRFTAKQVAAMEKVFATSAAPPQAEIDRLAAAIADEPGRVKAWFGRKRAAIKAQAAAEAASEEANAKRKREAEAALEAETERKRIHMLETTTDIEFLRAEVLKSLDTIQTLSASNASLTADVASAQAALAKASAAQASRVANASFDASRAGDSIARTLKAQLVVNLSEQAWAVLSAGRGKTFTVDAQQFAATFSTIELAKCLRYGAVLVPAWPLRVSYSVGTLKVTGKYVMMK